MIATLLVLAKEPVPGRVKTRLVPPFSYHQAAALAGAALQDTLSAASAVPARRRVLVIDGDATAWTPPGWSAVPQVAGGLDARIAAAFCDAEGPAVLVGMDTPQLRPAYLPDFDPSLDALLGPAEDGGFWALGLADPSVAAGVVSGVPMSTASTGAHQLARLRAAGLRVGLLAPLVDVDDVGAARTVAAAAPGTEFARLLGALDTVRVA